MKKLLILLFVITMFSFQSVLAQDMDITMYFHHKDAAVDINGIQAVDTMDTTKIWSDYNFYSNEVTGGGKMPLSFYQSPTLASDITISEINTGLWLNSSGNSVQGSVTFSVYEILADGTIEDVSSFNPGSTQMSQQTTFYPFSWSVDYTFHKGSAIKTYIEINPSQSRIASFWFDSPSYNSLFKFTTIDHIEIRNITSVLVNASLETSNFSIFERDKRVQFRANITDPLGDYDIKQVTITITAPNGTKIVDEQMTVPHGSSLSNLYSSVATYNWEYSNVSEIGEYVVSVTAKDNSDNSISSSYTFEITTNIPKTGIGENWIIILVVLILAIMIISYIAMKKMKKVESQEGMQAL